MDDMERWYCLNGINDALRKQVKFWTGRSIPEKTYYVIATWGMINIMLCEMSAEEWLLSYFFQDDHKLVVLTTEIFDVLDWRDVAQVLWSRTKGSLKLMNIRGNHEELKDHLQKLSNSSSY